MDTGAGTGRGSGVDLSSLDEDGLWELIEDHRARVTLMVRPELLIAYLRQARVLSAVDEDEILTCLTLKNRSMRASERFVFRPKEFFYCR